MSDGMTDERLCFHCGGTGTMMMARVAGGELFPETCPWCEGRGQVEADARKRLEADAASRLSRKAETAVREATLDALVADAQEQGGMGYEQSGSQEVTEAAPEWDEEDEQLANGEHNLIAKLRAQLAERDRQIGTYVSPCGKPGHYSNHAGDTRDLSGSTFYCVQCAELAEKHAQIAQLKEDAREERCALEGAHRSANALYLAIANVVDQHHWEKDHRDSEWDVLPGGVDRVIRHYRDEIAKLRSDVGAMTECKDAWKEVAEEAIHVSRFEEPQLSRWAGAHEVARRLESAIAPGVEESL